MSGIDTEEVPHLPPSVDARVLEQVGKGLIEILFNVAHLFLQSKLNLASVLSEDDEAKLMEDPLDLHSPHSLLCEIGPFVRIHVERLTPIIMGDWDECMQRLEGMFDVLARFCVALVCSDPRRYL